MSGHQLDAMALSHQALAKQVARQVPSTEPPLHGLQAHDAIAAELVACTLGHRTRPELRTDLLGKLSRGLAQVARAFRPYAALIAASQPQPPTRWERARAATNRWGNRVLP